MTHKLIKEHFEHIADLLLYANVFRKFMNANRGSWYSDIIAELIYVAWPHGRGKLHCVGHKKKRKRKKRFYCKGKITFTN